jgi:hypothetical protein
LFSVAKEKSDYHFPCKHKLLAITFSHSWWVVMTVYYNPHFFYSRKSLQHNGKIFNTKNIILYICFDEFDNNNYCLHRTLLMKKQKKKKVEKA